MIRGGYECSALPDYHVARQRWKKVDHQAVAAATASSFSEITLEMPKTLNNYGTALCGICQSSPSKYTCPRCHIKTCSLNCTKEHQRAQSCSGERNKSTYVPMKDYGYASMVDDLVFLEDIGRNVGQWGREIVNPATFGKPRDTMKKRETKKDILVDRLAELGVEMLTMPEKMHRRKVNQSHLYVTYFTLEFDR